MTCINCPGGGQVCGPNPTTDDCPVFLKSAEKCPEDWCWLHKIEMGSSSQSAWKHLTKPLYFYNDYKKWHEKCACGGGASA